MNIQYKDFIGFYHNVYPEGYCQHLISEFDGLADKGAGTTRQTHEQAFKHHKNDYQLFLNAKCHDLGQFEGKNPTSMFFEGLQKCYENYCNNFSVLKDSGQINGTHMKMQRTDSGGGYHIWHAEQGGNYSANRVLTYMLYLNTLPEESCGETEFLYQQQRVRTEENLLLIWPAAYTHAHRGNPVYGNTSKYIVTGWFYFD
jgi:hypothetical protein